MTPREGRLFEITDCEFCVFEDGAYCCGDCGPPDLATGEVRLHHLLDLVKGEGGGGAVAPGELRAVPNDGRFDYGPWCADLGAAEDGVEFARHRLPFDCDRFLDFDSGGGAEEVEAENEANDDEEQFFHDI